MVLPTSRVSIPTAVKLGWKYLHSSPPELSFHCDSKYSEFDSEDFNLPPANWKRTFIILTISVNQVHFGPAYSVILLMPMITIIYIMMIYLMMNHMKGLKPLR